MIPELILYSHLVLNQGALLDGWENLSVEPKVERVESTFSPQEGFARDIRIPVVVLGRTAIPADLSPLVQQAVALSAEVPPLQAARSPQFKTLPSGDVIGWDGSVQYVFLKELDQLRILKLKMKATEAILKTPPRKLYQVSGIGSALIDLLRYKFNEIGSDPSIVSLREPLESVAFCLSPSCTFSFTSLNLPYSVGIPGSPYSGPIDELETKPTLEGIEGFKQRERAINAILDKSPLRSNPDSTDRTAFRNALGDKFRTMMSKGAPNSIVIDVRGPGSPIFQANQHVAALQRLEQYLNNERDRFEQRNTDRFRVWKSYWSDFSAASVWPPTPEYESRFKIELQRLTGAKPEETMQDAGQVQIRWGLNANFTAAPDLAVRSVSIWP